MYNGEFDGDMEMLERTKASLSDENEYCSFWDWVEVKTAGGRGVPETDRWEIRTSKGKAVRKPVSWSWLGLIFTSAMSATVKRKI